MKGNSPEVLSLRGLVLFLTGKLPSAITHVQGALRLDLHTDLLNNYGGVSRMSSV